MAYYTMSSFSGAMSLDKGPGARKT